MSKEFKSIDGKLVAVDDMVFQFRQSGINHLEIMPLQVLQINTENGLLKVQYVNTVEKLIFDVPVGRVHTNVEYLLEELKIRGHNYLEIVPLQLKEIANLEEQIRAGTFPPKIIIQNELSKDMVI